MKWILTTVDEPLRKHAEILYEVLKNTEDINLMTPLEKISLDHRLKADLGMDSIQTVSVLYELETTYPHLTEQMIPLWKTIRDVLQSMDEDV
jgi:acyl carrier protein